MGVEAARSAVRSTPGLRVDELWFSTADPAYLDKTNATAIHAALRLDSDCAALDLGGAVRSGVGALRIALAGTGTTLVVTSDLRTGLPTSPDESAGGDAAAALLVGDSHTGETPVIAEYLGSGSATEEFLDRWRTPGDQRSKVWEERFGETKYVPLGDQAWTAALKAAELTPTQVDRVIITGLHSRAVRALTKRLGARDDVIVDDLAMTVGNTGAAHPGLLLTSALEQAEPDQVLALVVLADGADVLLFRTTDALAAYRPARPIGAQVEAGADLPYGKFLSWRGMVTVEPPRRPACRHRRPGAPKSGSWRSSGRKTAAPARCTCRRPACRPRAGPSTTWSPRRWPMSRPPSSRSRSTGSRIRKVLRSCSPSWTSTVAAASRSSSPTWTRTR